jgi:hypothetical protein
MENELVTALRDLLNYVGGWDIKDTAHPIYKAQRALERAEGKRPTFFEWFDGVNAATFATPAGAFMKENGFAIAHTGGGCLAWSKAQGDWELWIVDGDAGLGAEEHGDAFQTAMDFSCQIQNKDGDFIEGLSGTTIAECIDWGNAALADPDAAQKAFREACNHRDSGRGECVHCGKAL